MAHTPSSHPVRGSAQNLQAEGPSAIALARKAIFWVIPIFYFLVSDSFYLRTYDSAQVKITVVQMGGLALLALWLCLLVEEGFKAFRKEDMITLAPFLAFMASGIFSILHAPYPGPSLDDFIRRCVYMTVALVLVREFTEGALSRLTRWIVITAAVANIYGFIQWIDTRFFPPGMGNGVDPFIWRWAFGQRVFSTFGNPNFFANFLVLTYPILICQWLKTRSFFYLPLLALLFLNLYSTETKGAWIGFSVSLSIFILAYFIFFIEGELRQILKRAIVIVVVVGLVFGGIILYYTKKRMQSVNFRVATWLSTWEMIETHPLIGIGIGSFKVIYPAYRRPVIFHIEGKSNTETDHSENEWIEVWFDEGVLGFGIFLWFVFSTVFIGFKALRHLTSVLTLKGGRPPPRAYDIMGYLIAFLGMLAHNSFDVSMRFVSSGVYVGLLSGLVVNLAHGFPLSHVQDRTEGPLEEAGPGQSGLLWLTRLLAWAGLVYAAWTFCREFAELQSPLSRMVYGGEILQWWIAWGCFLFVVLGLTGVFAVLCLYTKRWLVPILVGAMLAPMFYFWGCFKADVYHNMAIAYSKQGQWTQALGFYNKVVALNPNFIMTNYFKGNVFVDRFDMRKEYHPEWGDTEGAPLDDFERAEAAYELVLGKAPNYVQTHHQRGVLYFKRGDYAQQHGDPEGARKYWDEAIRQFRKYQNLDPVFPPNYFRLAQIYLMRKEFDKAIAVYNEYLDAKPCVVHRHDEPPTPEAAEAHTLMANAYFLKGDFVSAEKAYKKALEINPGHAGARQNLQFLYQKAKDMKLLRELPAPVSGPPPEFDLTHPRH